MRRREERKRDRDVIELFAIVRIKYTYRWIVSSELKMCMCVASTRLIVCVACCNSSAELIELYGNDMTIIICHSIVT